MSPTDITTLRQIEGFFEQRAGLFMLAIANGAKAEETLQQANVCKHWQQVIGRVLASTEDTEPAALCLTVEQQLRLEQARHQLAWQAVADYARSDSYELPECHDYTRPHSAGFTVFP